MPNFKWFNMIIFSTDEYKRDNWTRHHLIYDKNDRKEWSGIDSCRMFMSTIVEQAKKNLVE